MARPKKEGKKNIRKDISMDPEQYERLMDYCRQQDRPISWVIRYSLQTRRHIIACKNMVSRNWPRRWRPKAVSHG